MNERIFKILESPYILLALGASFLLLSVLCFIFAYKIEEYEVKVFFNVIGIFGLVAAIISAIIFVIFSRNEGSIF